MGAEEVAHTRRTLVPAPGPGPAPGSDHDSDQPHLAPAPAASGNLVSTAAAAAAAGGPGPQGPGTCRVLARGLGTGFRGPRSVAMRAVGPALAPAMMTRGHRGRGWCCSSILPLGALEGCRQSISGCCRSTARGRHLRARPQPGSQPTRLLPRPGLYPCPIPTRGWLVSAGARGGSPVLGGADDSRRERRRYEAQNRRRSRVPPLGR